MQGELVNDTTPVGRLVIGNLRSKERAPYCVPVRVDRSSGSPLGNRFHMQNESQRERVCGQYAVWFRDQVGSGNESVLGELRRILSMLREGKNIELLCWCFPKRCHAETIRDWLNAEIAGNV